MTPQEQPDSQAGDELDTILQVLCDTVFQHGQALRTSNPFHHGEPMKDARALIEAYAERLAAERATAAQKALLKRLKQEATETKDVKTGAIRQTVGLGYIFNELATLERQQLTNRADLGQHLGQSRADDRSEQDNGQLGEL